MVQINPKDLYQLLISECRYGYTRNNHLMPDGAYDHVRAYLDVIYADDETMAISTVQQLLEECISDQLTRNFSDGLDDEFGNRASAIEFIDYLRDWLRKHDAKAEVYNDRLYYANIATENELRYDLVYLRPGTFEDPGFDVIEPIKKGILSYGKAYDTLISDVLGTDQLVVNRVPLKTNSGKVYGSKLRICEPAEHRNELYAIVLSETD